MTIEDMKSFNRFDAKNIGLYNDRAYKVIKANNAVDLGLYEEKNLKNGQTKKVKSKAAVRQNVIISFSRKMMEYLRYIRNRQIERAEKLLKDLDPDSKKKGPNDTLKDKSDEFRDKTNDYIKKKFSG